MRYSSEVQRIKPATASPYPSEEKVPNVAGPIVVRSSNRPRTAPQRSCKAISKQLSKKLKGAPPPPPTYYINVHNRPYPDGATL